MIGTHIALYMTKLKLLMIAKRPTPCDHKPGHDKK